MLNFCNIIYIYMWLACSLCFADMQVYYVIEPAHMWITIQKKSINQLNKVTV